MEHGNIIYDLDYTQSAHDLEVKVISKVIIKVKGQKSFFGLSSPNLVGICFRVWEFIT